MVDFSEYGPPIKVDGGIKARSRRGSIGSQWWSRRFVDILERICDPGRLSRGRAYARKGQVMSMTLTPGLVRGLVQGSRPKPYDVTISITAYPLSVWQEIERALRSRAVFRASLLAGEMPHEIEAVFGDAGHPLFPAPEELRMSCSCPDSGVPCKHLSAVLYLLGEAFDDDPFQVLAWRGRDRQELLDGVRGGGAVEAVADEPVERLADRLGDFYSPAIPLSRLRHRPVPADVPVDLLLRAVEPPALRVKHLPLLDILRPAYRRIGDALTHDPPEDGVA
jgi:uncharacterized Zn finger protein